MFAWPMSVILAKSISPNLRHGKSIDMYVKGSGLQGKIFNPHNNLMR